MTSPVEEIIVDEADEEVYEEEDMNAGDSNSQIMNRPDVLAALQGRDHSSMLENLPQCVKRRIKALKKLQLKTTHIEAAFFEEVHKLEYKYLQYYMPLYTKREEIVTGEYEPNDEDCDFPSDDEKDTDELSNDLRTKISIKDTKEKEEEISGIPDFWLTIFKNVAMLNDMVQAHDEPILKHLLDVKVILLAQDPMGFVLEFHFGINEYFSNSVLSKEYLMKCTPDPSDPFSFEGPEIYKCRGCTIDWYKGKNVTVKTIKKKQKHRARGSIRTITKTVQNDSFFNFFSPPYVSEEQESDLDEDTQALLTSDFEIGHYIRERIIPRAVLYFTGEALEDEEDYDDEEAEDEGEEDEDDNESERVVKSLKSCQQHNECKPQ